MTEKWSTQVVNDLRPFCDLGTEPTVTEYPAFVSVDWTRDGRPRTSEFRRLGDGSVVVRPQDGADMSYRAFLASSEMADLRTLAERIKTLARMRRSRSQRKVRSTNVYTNDWYVDPRVSIEREGHPGGRAVPVLCGLIDDDSGGPHEQSQTDLIFLTAQAGQGKSSALRVVHQIQSQRYLDGETERLTFFVDAQGRGLANLTEVLSREINELRLALPYQAILSLVREGVLTLIIDGFDELVGARGTYENAFDSLTSFLEMLEGKGQVLAAARSSYFTAEYLSRPTQLSGTSGRHRVTRIQLMHWSREDRAQFLDKAEESTSAGMVTARIRSQIQEIVDAPSGGLMNRPLFSRDVLISLIEDPGSVAADSELTLVDAIVRNYLAREVQEKLLDAASLPMLSIDQLMTFYLQVAGEMWDLETRELDVPTMRAIMDIHTESWDLSAEHCRILGERVGHLPLFAGGGALGNSRQFEHEVFYAYFVSNQLREASMDSTASLADAQLTLAKSRVTADEANMVAERLWSGGGKLSEVLTRLRQIGSRPHPRRTQIQLNVGSLAASLIRSAPASEGRVRLNLDGFVFDGDSLRDVELVEAQLTNCQMNRVDLRNARVSGDATGTEIYVAILDESTRFDVTGLDPDLPVVQVEKEDEGTITPVYDQEERLHMLVNAGFVEGLQQELRFKVSADQLEAVAMLCRAFDEMNPVGDNHTKYRHLFEGGVWPRLRRCLVESGLVNEETQPTSGPRQNFFRKRFMTSELLAATTSVSSDPAIEEFWRAFSAH